jgi:hypothetical protein
MKKRKTQSKKEFEDWASGLAKVRILQIIYQKQKNPYAPWLAYKLSRELGEDVPEWVLSYLDNSAKRINNLDSSKNKKNDLLKALKFNKPKGERSFATELKQVMKYLPSTIDCYMLAKIGDRKKPELKRIVDIFSTVAGELSLEEETLHKYYYRYKSIVPELLKESGFTRSLTLNTLRKRYPSMVRS